MTNATEVDVGDGEVFKVKTLDAPMIYCSWQWGINIFHWMFDNLPSVLFLRKYYPEQLKKPVGVLRDHIQCRHVQDWATLLGITMVPRDTIDPAETVFAVWPKRLMGQASPFAVREFNTFSSKFTRNGKAILVQRNNAGALANQSRNLENRDEIVALLAKHGIKLKTVFLEGLAVEYQMRLFRESDLIIAVTGSALANLAFCRAGTVVVEISSPMLCTGEYKALSGCVGVKHVIVKGEERHGVKDFYRHCVYCDPKTVLDAAKATMNLP